MARIEILDCTLRDGGLSNGGNFSDDQIRLIIGRLSEARIDYIETGYLNTEKGRPNSSYFSDIDHITPFLPGKAARGHSKYAAMADVGRFDPKLVKPRRDNSIDAIRVAFYQHQIQEALEFCKIIEYSGYSVFLQPMVTVDYSLSQYSHMIDLFSKFNLYAVMVVDSFGYMKQQEIFSYLQMLEHKLSHEVIFGFHGHNNMQLALLNAQALFEYETPRKLIIDSSIMGMGRGAGNLNTELIANMYNQHFGDKYEIEPILAAASDVVAPMSKSYAWGYSPYYFLTAQKKCHQCFAQYLLANHDITISDFSNFLDTIPEDMKTKCTKPYVEQLYHKFAGVAQ